MENQRKQIRQLTQGAMIAALYVLLTILSNAFGLANGPVQLRLSEALTVLPMFTSAAVPGLFVGCILANLLTGCAVWDVIAGSLATLAGAIGTRLLRKHPVLCLLPPIAANTVVVPLVLMYVYAAEGTLPYFVLTVFLGEALSCGVLGSFLRIGIGKYAGNFKWE